MNKGDIFSDVEIIDYTFEGQGVAKINNFIIFIPYALKNNVVDIEIVKVKKKFAFAKIINSISVKTSCEYFNQCGSCDLLHIPYEQQLDLKQNVIKNMLNKNNIKSAVQQFSASSANYNYRNKISLPVTRSNNKIKLGYFKKNSHDILPIKSCILANDTLNNLILEIENALNFVNEKEYDFKLYTGNVRHVVIRGWEDEYMVIFVCATGKLKTTDEVVRLLSANSNVKSIVINVNKKKSQQIMGQENIIIYGQENISLMCDNTKFAIKPNAFFQINSYVINDIYKYLKTLTSFHNKNILDAFCGTGTIGLSLAKQAQTVVGIEINKEAIASALENKQKLKLDNISFICDDIENGIKVIDINQIDVVIVDPPRRGLSQNMQQTIAKMNIEELIYISCDINTLVRDLKIFAEKYVIRKIKGFDMFPHTKHFEVVAYLTLKEKDETTNNTGS